MLADAGSVTVTARVVTKAPPWHGWVTADLFLSSLGAGTFSVAAICLLARSDEFALTARIAFLIVFPVLLADLACLIIDLGDPARFHHMLRVFKPGSPMSVGVWTLSVFSIIAFIAFAATILRLSNSTIELIAAVGLIPALIAGAYKGVLFSATAQPGWSRMRWLGAAFSISSATMGLAVVMTILELPGQQFPAFRYCLEAVLYLFAFAGADVAFVAARDAGLRPGVYAATLFLLVAVEILVVSTSVPLDGLAAAAVLGLALVYRHLIVVLPHRLGGLPPK
jgi:Polysulphide reductase, NrfD